MSVSVQPAPAEVEPAVQPVGADVQAGSVNRPAGQAVMTLGYLTSAYARSSDTFIRGEVAQLRALGHTVHTFSVRKPAESELITDDIRREHAQTDYILGGGTGRLLAATFKTLCRRPGRMLGAARLAMQLGWPGAKGRLWPLIYLVEAAYLAQQLRARGVAHLHNHLGEGSAGVALLAAHLAGVPFSLTIHGSSEWDQPMNFALGLKVRRAAFVACVCEYARSQLYRWCDLKDWPKLHLVRCGVTADFLDAPPTPVPPDRRLVFVGRLHEVKGLPVLIEAARRLAAEGLEFQLVLVGDGPLRGTVEAQIAQHGLQRHVHILGYLPPAGIREQLLRSRAMVLTSFAEGLPVVMMESLALRRPVIGPWLAGIPELIEPGANGWLVPPGSVEKLADAMRAALTAPPAELDRMGHAGAARVAEWHDQAKEARRLEVLLTGESPED